jgi:predicted SnoaL-like aldol condensation-catalyzing enzyme
MTGSSAATSDTTTHTLRVTSNLCYLRCSRAAEREPNKSFDVQRIVASGDHVVVHSRLTRHDGSKYAVVHICRFEHGKIVELWDLAQAVPENSPNEHGMF